VLIMQPHLAMLAPFLEPHFTVWRFWEHPPVEAQGMIEAMVIAGEFPVDKALAEALPRLSLIACFTVGYDGVDLAWARARGLKVTHSPGVNHEDVADHAMGLILAAWRKIAFGDAQLRAGAWKPHDKLITPTLSGAAVARRCLPFGLEVHWWGPREKPDAPWPRAVGLVQLARASDILVVACRADDGSRGLISAEIIEAVGPDGLIVNVSRGQVVDEDALIAALRARRLGMAALDVFATEPTPPERWADVPGTVLTPHTAGASSAAVPKMVAMTVTTLQRHFAGEVLENLAVG
jgi:lactate dehydrogenase-like 2-hydroxyacid dehydrogenase